MPAAVRASVNASRTAPYSVGQAGPECGRLQRLGERTGVKQGVAQVRRLVAVPQPLRPDCLGQRPGTGRDQKSRDGGADVDRAALVGEQRDARYARADPGAQHGLGLVREPDHRRQWTILCQLPDRRQRFEKGVEAPRIDNLLRRDRMHPHRNRGDHPERALRSEQQLPQIRSSRRPGCAAGLDRADRGRRAKSDHHLVEAPVPG